MTTDWSTPLSSMIARRAATSSGSSLQERSGVNRTGPLSAADAISDGTDPTWWWQSMMWNPSRAMRPSRLGSPAV